MTVTHYVATGIIVTFATLTGELIDVDVSGEETDIVDCSFQGSASAYKEFKVALTDGGTVTLLLAFDPDAVVPAAGTSGTVIVTWPTGATKKLSATALFKGRGASAKLGARMTMPITLKITGKPNHDYT
jgi:hypothetical protein